jgi:restriction system protein
LDRTDRSDQSDPSDLITPSYERYRAFIEDGDAETAANTLICLIPQANYLLDYQIAALERQFIQEGGYSEQLAAARRRERRVSNHADRFDQADRSDQAEAPSCPRCGNPMALRTARHGTRAGSKFWGCPNYPDCTGTRPQQSQ